MCDLVESQWRISEGHQLLCRPFGDQYVIYHCGSGDTHLVDRVGFCVLNELNHQVCSFERILEKLTEEFDFELPEESQKYLNTLISEFQKLSVIERLDT